MSSWDMCLNVELDTWGQYLSICVLGSAGCPARPSYTLSFRCKGQLHNKNNRVWNAPHGDKTPLYHLVPNHVWILRVNFNNQKESNPAMGSSNVTRLMVVVLAVKWKPKVGVIMKNKIYLAVLEFLGTTWQIAAEVYFLKGCCQTRY